MKMYQTLTGLGLLLGVAAFNAHASLTSYVGAGNVDLVYSSVSDVTWTQDANLFMTLYDADYTLVDKIISGIPNGNEPFGLTYNDPGWGMRTVGQGDFTSNGLLTWWGAKAFIRYLNIINYGDSNQWRLPTSNAILGYNKTAGNELGQLFYSELGGATGRAIPNTPTFDNEQAYPYLSGTEYAPNLLLAWGLDTYDGNQTVYGKNDYFFVWAVSSGQVAAVPMPSAVWLFGMGLMGLLGLKRRNHAT